jgi:hypothetical protein
LSKNSRPSIYNKKQFYSLRNYSYGVNIVDQNGRVCVGTKNFLYYCAKLRYSTVNIPHTGNDAICTADSANAKGEFPWHEFKIFSQKLSDYETGVLE